MKNQCLMCNLETRNKKFCSSSCSASYNNSRRIRTLESKKKTSDSIKKLIETGQLQVLPPNQKGKTWRKSPDNSWLEYKNSCAFYTPYHLLPLIEGHELVKQYGWYHPKKNLSGASRDHMFSIAEGWKQNIPPEIIRHPANCKIMLIQDNKKKSKKCSITYEELILRIEKWRSRQDSNLHNSA